MRYTPLLMLLCCCNINAHPLDSHADSYVEPIMLAANDSSTSEDVSRLTGPDKTQGILSVESLGVVDLGNEFNGMAGKEFRARVFTIAPGGVVSVHTHENRPGYAFILEGSIVEHRNDKDKPVTHQAGSIAIEKSGVSHWWENVSASPVKALVVDIYTPEPND